MVLLALLLSAALQTPPDPHNGTFTSALGVRCAFCHDRTRRRSQDEYDKAREMSKMVSGLNEGAMRPFAGISCLTCHRGGPGIQPRSTPPSSTLPEWPPSLALAESDA